MNKYIKISIVVFLFCGVGLLASADRGRFDLKKKITLNINPDNNIKNAIAINLKSGIVYKGSTLMKKEVIGNSIISDVMVSYKKGNIIYILPYKQRISISQYSKNEGSKMTIRLKK